MSETILFIRKIAADAIDEITEEAYAIQLEVETIRRQVVMIRPIATTTVSDCKTQRATPVCLPDKLPSDRRCLVRDLTPDPKSEPIISEEDIDRFKTVAEKESNPAKHFLKLVYGSTSYRSIMNSKKRGNKALNWRLTDNGVFKCSSLHKANNVYEAMHKKNWNKNTNRKKYACAPEAFRCQHILKSNALQQCSKHKCANSEFCTLHYKKFILNR